MSNLYADLLTKFNQYLHEVNLQNKQPSGLYAPAHYLMQLGGKRVRPLLCFSGCLLAGGNIQQVMPAAFGIEAFHNFTLAHDDIMDDSPLRRGQPTLHEKFNLNTAILSGDLLFALAYQQICQCPDAILPHVTRAFNHAAIGVCEGQQYDVDFETLPIEAVTVPQYINMIRLKTAVLLGASFEIGALYGGATPEQARLLYHYGELTGIAFQIIDDILDVYGDAAVFGKRPAGDIIRNKKTVLLLHTAQTLPPPQQKALLQWLSPQPTDEPQKIEAITELFQQAGARQYAQQIADDYYQQ
nr:polyprenyl synthetase family protein [Chitinophagales bacterium]